MSEPVAPPVDLTTCDREPIHVPGAIQPHGALLAFDRTGLRVRSANAGLLGPLPDLDAPLSEGHLNAEIRAEIAALLVDEARVPEVISAEVSGVTYDVVAHRADGLLIVEFEARAVDAPALQGFALVAQRAIMRIQGAREIQSVLRAVAMEVRALTGFDRVMVYRFQPDDSGLVEAEARREELEPFLGQRYPASDIPAQARRLYVINPLRLIADVAYRPVALEPARNPLTRAALDLSHSVLRSVSPIHVEYLTNMGVFASMSISIVIGGALWGLVACHHTSPRLVPHAVRMACQLLAQSVSILIERAETARSSVALERSLSVQTALLSKLTQGADLLPALATTTPTIADLVTCAGATATVFGELASVGRVPPPEGLSALLRWLRERDHLGVFATSHVAQDCPALSAHLDGLCGFLALRFSRDVDGYVVWFRAEEREEVRWGGNPHKQYAVGPLGPRLTPRGSFQEWRETVLGRSVPWSEDEQAAAQRLRRELQDVALANARRRILVLEQSNVELDRLAYVVSHDLRAPLRAVASLSEFIEEDLREGDHEGAIGHARVMRERIVKLDTLITAILSYSRAGHRREPPRWVRVADLVRESLELLAPPPTVTVVLEPELPTLVTHAALLQQVLMNLLGNALKYGLRDGSGTITVGSVDRGPMWELWVRDDGQGIDSTQSERIFKLFSRVTHDAAGTGVGLAIVRRIVESQGGRAWVDASLGRGATFHFLWPRQEPRDEGDR